MKASRQPDAAGFRLEWSEIPGRVRAAVEDRLGSPVVLAFSQSAGFSPGVAARLGTEDGRRFFAKAAGPNPNPLTPAAHRREAEVAAALPEEAPVPRLLHSHDEGEDGWIVLIFEDVEGRNPAVPWRSSELDQTLDAIATLSELLTPSPLPVGRRRLSPCAGRREDMDDSGIYLLLSPGNIVLIVTKGDEPHANRYRAGRCPTRRVSQGARAWRR
jgi:hypothetical protein